METTVKFGGQNRDFKLTGAILIYSEITGGPGIDGCQNGCAATIHDIQLHERRPVIQPGRPVTVQALEAMMKGMGRRNTMAAFIPETVLSLGMDSMVWWCPSGRRRIWFKPSHQDKEAAKALNGKFVHHPPLMFVASHGLSVYALPEDKRPTAKTVLYLAPYWNLNEGHMCNGNLDLPTISPENIEGFEKAFFNSAFTHSSAGTLTKHAGGHNGLWAELSKRKTKPDGTYWKKHLITAETTIHRVIKDI